MTVSGVDVGLMVGRNIDTGHAAGLEDNDDSTYANFTFQGIVSKFFSL